MIKGSRPPPPDPTPVSASLKVDLGAGDMTQLVDYLPIRLEALGSTTGMAETEHGGICLQPQNSGDRGRRMRSSR